MKPLSFDQVAAEERFLLEPASAQTPADLFERAWASIAINKALGHLRKSYADEGKIHIYDKLQTYMSGNDADGHGQLAEELGWNPSTLRVAVHRMRKRFRKMLEQEIAQTVDGRDAIKDEIAHLLGLFSRS